MSEKWLDLIRNCRACSLAPPSCAHPVAPLVSHPSGSLLFIGSAPGRAEEEAHIPLAGLGGALVAEALHLVGLTLKQASFANVVACRPPNRSPTKQEAIACWSNLSLTINILDPSVIVLMGGLALKTFWEGRQIASERGRPFWSVVGRGRTFVPTWHPEYVIREGLDFRAQFIADVALARLLSLDLTAWPIACQECGSLDVAEFDAKGRASCFSCAPENVLFQMERIPKSKRRRPAGSR